MVFVVCVIELVLLIVVSNVMCVVLLSVWLLVCSYSLLFSLSGLVDEEECGVLVIIGMCVGNGWLL